MHNRPRDFRAGTTGVDSPHNNFRRQNKGNFRGYSQRRPIRGRGMPSRSNYHSQRYEYASSASILFNKSDKTSQHQLHIVSGKINFTDCTVLRDTGCTCVGIRQSLLKPNDFTNETATCQMFDGSEKKFRKATAFIETPFFTGKVTALALANPVVDFIVGNIIGVGDQLNLNEQSPTWKGDPDSAHKAHAYVSTRAQKSTADNVNPNNNSDNKQTEKNENTSYKTAVSEFKREDLEKEQQSDPTLETVRAKAKNNDETYYTYNGIIFRRANNKSDIDQIVLPKSIRQEVLQVCHDSPIAGHLGINATKKRVCSRFSWPGIIRDVNKYVKSCDVCQRNCNKLPNLPIQIADIIDKPFDKVAIDIVGPMMMSDSKNRFILTLVDAATR
ncbi:gypsy retrotransposon integrase-like protein 1 [Plakobranchus ocellatus]|uniref:Gypsy retrotransposon integrase-like protein 1 n=1 Tax=Plakobranchus ocellatus TaxID=259542 RepID=A0AAV4BBB5_9GAST|nr:gypsy retrotransposon integrase-like protein 1 [Plakobranchus ocellatus]